MDMRKRVRERRRRADVTAWAGSWLCLLFVSTCGCGSKGPAVEMVEGVVLLDGQPVEGATVFFTPVGADVKANRGLPAAGLTRAAGAFRLNAAGGAKPGAGTKVGDYVVTVIKQESDPLPPPDMTNPLTAPPQVKVRELLPTVYKQPETSPLRAVVKKGKNVYRFELDSAATAKPKK